MEIKKRRRKAKSLKVVPRTSSGDRGRRPRYRRSSPDSGNGGDSSQRNRKWTIKRQSDKIRVLQSSDDKLNKIELEGYIYLDTNDEKLSEEYYEKLKKVIDSIGFEVSRENDAKKGSWVKKFWFKAKELLTRKQVIDRLEKIERGIELKHIDKVQSEVNLDISQAISNLLLSTKDIPNISTLAGSLLFAKATSLSGEPIIFAQTLTQHQLKIVKDHPSLMHRPFDLINKMEEVKVKVLAEKKQKKLAGK